MSKQIPIFLLMATFLLVKCNPTRAANIEPAAKPFTLTPSSHIGALTSSPTGTTLSTSPMLVATITPQPSPTLTPSATITPQPKLTLTASPTFTPQHIVRVQAVSIETGVPDKFEGALVVAGKESYLLSLPDLKQHTLPQKSGSGICIYDWITVSPDGKWLAYTLWFNELSDRQLQIVDADGQPLPISRQEDQEHVIGWLDNERLALTKKDHPDGTVLVFNPFTGETQELAPSFPPLVSDKPEGMPFGLTIWHASNSPFVIYEPTLTRVAYMRLQRYGEQYKIYYLLWDTQQKRVLWEKPTMFFDYRPVWSPDGEYFAVELNPEPIPESSEPFADLFLVSRDGQETLLTDKVVGSLTWSPDGNFIATWWRGISDCGDPLTANLAVIEVKTKSVTVYCIQAARFDQYPVWSPDGHYIALDILTGDIDVQRKVDVTGVVIVDLAQGKAYEVATDAKVRGWMVNPLASEMPATKTPTP